MAVPQTSSRLQLLQARFQQKQLQEKEQKLLQLYDQQQQRAHQVAQRGSAGSNGSIADADSVQPLVVRTRQMFTERRRAKGIDKSYPLEPLVDSSKKRALPPAGSGSGSKQSLKAGQPAAPAASRRQQLAKENHQRNQLNSADDDDEVLDSSSRFSNGRLSNGDVATAGPSIDQQQLNGHRYSINIDEVIDNDAMERNRMVARQSIDLEMRRQFASGDAAAEVASDRYGEKILHDVSNKQVTKTSKSSERRSSLAEAKERSRNASLTRNGSVRRSTEMTVPVTVETNTQQPRFMNTTTSASLKVNKLRRNKRILEKKKTNTASCVKSRKIEDSSRDLMKQTRNMVRDTTGRRIGYPATVVVTPGVSLMTKSSKGSASPLLKSTSIVCEAMQKQPIDHLRHRKTDDNSKAGNVKAIVLKIERTASDLLGRSRSPTLERKSSLTGSTKRTERSGRSLIDMIKSIDDEEEARSRRMKRRSIPTDHYVSLSDLKVKSRAQSESPQRSLSAYDELHRARRASFESKRKVFERPSSQEELAKLGDALRRTSIVGAKERSKSEERSKARSRASTPGSVRKFTPRASKESSLDRAHRCDCCFGKDDEDHEDCKLKGFQRSTSSFRMKSADKKKIPVTPTTRSPVATKKVTLAPKSSISKAKPVVSVRATASEIAPARDLMKQTRNLVRDTTGQRIVYPATVVVTPGVSSLVARSPKIKAVDAAKIGRNDYLAKKSRFLRNQVARLKSVFMITDSSKSKKPYLSVRKQAEPVARRSNPNARLADSAMRKSFSLYAPLRNAENNNEQQIISQQSSMKNSSSLKFLNKIVESQSDMSYASENKPTPAPRKSSITGITESTVEKPISPAARTLTPGASRSSPNASGSRTTAKLNNNNHTASPTSGIGDSLTMCKICNRRFNSERITLHEKICSKTAQKKRKTFDATTQRVKGTELESYAVKPSNKKQSKITKSEPSKPAPAKPNWRRKHEDFINAIRSAKQMQAHLDAGGKLSDLPPPPASDTSDYIQCPHCSRKFSPGAAERHIPKCETMQHNKGPSRNSRIQPKPVTTRRH